MKLLFVIDLILMTAGCAARAPERTSEQNPKVAYNYSEGDTEKVQQIAAKFCYDTYGRSARVIDDVKSGDQRLMTFECVITP